MAVDKNHCRLCVTFTKKQYNWLKSSAKKLGMTASHLVKFLVEKNIGNLLAYLPEEERDEMIRIIKTPWIKYPDNDE